MFTHTQVERPPLRMSFAHTLSCAAQHKHVTYRYVFYTIYFLFLSTITSGEHSTKPGEPNSVLLCCCVVLVKEGSQHHRCVEKEHYTVVPFIHFSFSSLGHFTFLGWETLEH